MAAATEKSLENKIVPITRTYNNEYLIVDKNAAIHCLR